MRQGALGAGICALAVAMAASVPAADAAPTWLAPQTLSVDGVNAGHQRVAMSARGDAVVVWNRNSGVDSSTRIQAARRPAGGAWTAPQTLDNAMAQALPEVAIDTAGDAMAVWNDGSQVRYAISLGGAPFGAAQTLAGVPNGRPQVAMDDMGDAAVVWLDNSGTHTVVRGAFRPAGRAFTTPQTLSRAGDDALEARVAMDAGGDAIAAWDITGASTATLQAAVRPAGGSWPASSPTDLDTGNTASDQPVATYGGGRWAVAWMADTSTGYELRVNMQPDAEGHLSGARVALSSELPQSPAIAQSPAGLTLAWTATAGGHQVIHTATTPGIGHAFGATQTISPSTADADFASLVMTDTGRATIAWQSVESSTTVLRAASRPDAASAFGVSQVISAAGESGRDTAAATDADGDALATWTGRPTGATSDVIRAAGYDSAGPQLRGLSIPSSGLTGESLSFSFSPLDVFSSVASSGWDFGDGTTSTGASVQHPYTAPGTYAVTASAVDAHGNASTAHGAVSISAPPSDGGTGVGGTGDGQGPAPAAAFTAPDHAIEVGEPVVFDASASTGSGLRYAWTFGDGGPSAVAGDQPTTQQSFSRAGTYAVRLTVTDDQGRTAEASELVSVVAMPSLTLADHPSYARVGEPLHLAFERSAPAAARAITSIAPVSYFVWTFGDDKPVSHKLGTDFVVDAGQPTIQPRVDHVYSKPGIYPVTGTYFDTGGLGGLFTATYPVTTKDGTLPFAWNYRGTHVGYSYAGLTAPGQSLHFIDVTQDLEDDYTSIACPVVKGAPKKICHEPAHTAEMQFGAKQPWIKAEEDGQKVLSWDHVFPAAGTYAVTLRVTDKNGTQATQTFKIPITAPMCAPVTVNGWQVKPLLGDCFVKDAGGNWRFHDARIDGLEIYAHGKEAMVLNPKTGTISEGADGSDPDIDVPPFKLWTGDVFKMHLQGDTRTFDDLRHDSAGKTVYGLRFNSAKVVVKRGMGTTILPRLKIPMLGRAQHTAGSSQPDPVPVDVKKLDDPGAPLTVTQPTAGYGNLDLGAVSLSHRPDGYWCAGFKYDFAGTVIDAHCPAGAEPIGATGLYLTPSGDFKSLGADASPPPGPPTVFNIFSLNDIGFTASLNPTKLEGRLALGTKPEYDILGKRLLSVDGCAAVILFAGSSESTPWCSATYTAPDSGEKFAARVEGSAALLGQHLGSAYVEYHSPHTVKFGGKVSISILKKLEILGQLDGGFESAKKWQFHAGIDVIEHLIGDEKLLGVDILVSSRGVGGCVDVGPDVGAYMRWNLKGDWFIHDCSDKALPAISVFRRRSAPFLSRSAPAAFASAARVALPVGRGVHDPVFELFGEDGRAPRIVLIDPQGHRFPQGEGITTELGGPHHAIYRGDGAGETAVYLHNPERGTWHAEIQDGSPQIDRIRGTVKVPPPAFLGKVIGHGTHRRLLYRSTSLPEGDRVFFVERSGSVEHVIGDMHAVRGSLPLAATTVAGPRDVYAEVQDAQGMPVAEYRIAGYTAPGPRAPGRVHLRVRRHGARFVLSWRRAPGASLYRVHVGAGKAKLPFDTTTRGRTVVVTGIAPWAPARVTVTPVSSRGLTGPTVKRSLRPVRQRPRVHL